MKKIIKSLTLSLLVTAGLFAYMPSVSQAREITDAEAKEIYKNVPYDPNYPLRGKLRFQTPTKEEIDKELEEGYTYFKNGVKLTKEQAREAEYEDIGKKYVIGDLVATTTLRGKEYQNPVLASLAGFITIEELNDEEKFVRDKVLEFMNSFDWQKASDYDKALKAFQWLNTKVVYDDNFNVFESEYLNFKEGKGQCDGLTNLYQMLTRAVGIASVRDNNKTHPVNYIRLDGKWYITDASYCRHRDKTVIKNWFDKDLLFDTNRNFKELYQELHLTLEDLNTVKEPYFYKYN